MNGERTKYGSIIAKGCEGAVYKNGKPSKQYCLGRAKHSNESYAWWKECCVWRDEKCGPKFRGKLKFNLTHVNKNCNDIVRYMTIKQKCISLLYFQKKIYRHQKKRRAIRLISWISLASL